MLRYKYLKKTYFGAVHAVAAWTLWPKLLWRFSKLAHRQNFGAKPVNCHNPITYVIQFISWIRPFVDRWYTGVLLLIDQWIFHESESFMVLASGVTKSFKILSCCQILHTFKSNYPSNTIRQELFSFFIYFLDVYVIVILYKKLNINSWLYFSLKPI